MTTHESNAAPFRRAARRGDERDTGVVTLLQELAPDLAVEPDPAFRLATRQRLVAMASVRTPEPVRAAPLRRLLAVRATNAPTARWRTRATAGLAGAALTVTSLAALVALSTGAGPGDVLYGLKRGTEQTQLALAGDSRGQILLDLARTRLDELHALDGDAALAEATLATMDQQTSNGASWLITQAIDTSDTALLDRLSDWTAAQTTQLSAVRAEVPAPAADDVEESLTLLAEVTTRVDGLRGALACPSGATPSGTDRLGPVPGNCLPLPAAPQTSDGAEGSSEPAAGAEVPELLPAPGGPTAPQVTPPAGPTGQQPAPGSMPAPGPGRSSPPSTTTPSGGLGGLLPSLPVPSLPTPNLPAPSSTHRPPLITVPAPSSLPLGVCLPPLLQLGRC